MYCTGCGGKFENGDSVFCVSCGLRKRLESKPKLQTEEQIITFYFKRGFQYESILHFMRKKHEISTSLRTLKRRLNDYGLKKSTNMIR